MRDAKTSDRMSTGLQKVVDRARKDPNGKILSLAHRIDVPALPQRQSSYAVLRLPLPRRPPLRSSLACGLPPASRWRWRVSQVSGSSSARVPRFPTPSVAPPSRPRVEGSAAAFELLGALGSGDTSHFVANSRGPLARAPTHQRVRYRARCKARYRPAGLSFGRAGFAPRWTTNTISGVPLSPSFVTSLTWSHPSTRF